MPKQTAKRKLSFIKSMEINGISPLPHYYEEIYANNVGIKKLGLRGDNNYLFYSKNGFGTGYYEEHEMELSAKSAFDHFKSTENRERFFNKIQQVLGKFDSTTKRIESEDLSSLSLTELASLFLTANQLHGEAFSLYIVSQPYRIKYIEKSIRDELRKRVARSRVDHYLTQLTAPGKTTKITSEEIDWLKLLIKNKQKHKDIVINENFSKDYPLFFKDIKYHFETYKSLTLGDGNWEYDISYYLNTLKHDYEEPIDDLRRKLKQREQAHVQTKKNKANLVDQLYLNDETVRDINFLSEIGHTRLLLRIEGWLPFVKQIIALDVELSKRLDIPKGPQLLNFMTEPELMRLAEKGEMVETEVLQRRVGKDSEFLIRNDEGEYKIYFGSEAGVIFNQLVPKIDHSETQELTGSTAVLGNVTGTACVYT